MSHDISLPTEQPQHPLQRLADARRVLEISCEGHPFMDAEGRAAIRDAKRIAWAVLAEVTEQLVATLDTAAGDDDLEPSGDEEDGNRTEDDFMYHGGNGPGCPVSDPDKAIDDDACDEPLMDLEPEDGI